MGVFGAFTDVCPMFWCIQTEFASKQRLLCDPSNVPFFRDDMFARLMNGTCCNILTKRCSCNVDMCPFTLYLPVFSCLLWRVALFRGVCALAPVTAV